MRVLLIEDDSATGFRFLLLFDTSLAQTSVVHRVRVLLK